MKKISLKNLNLHEVEQLSREQLKDLLGGQNIMMSTGSCPDGEFRCTCNGTDYGCVCSMDECWDQC